MVFYSKDEQCDRTRTAENENHVSPLNDEEVSAGSRSAKEEIPGVADSNGPSVPSREGIKMHHMATSDPKVISSS
jgi:hypothetical protein